jgi:hypothetical protein
MQNVRGSGRWFLLAPVDGFGVLVGGGFWGLAVEGRCRVAAFGLSGLLELAVFFITVSHCAWPPVISLSKADKEMKQRKRFPTIGKLVSLACRPQFLAPDSTVLARLTDV